MDWRKEPARRSLKVAAWPEADRQAWEAATRKGDVLEPGGLGGDWAPLTRMTTASYYGRWLGWLQRHQLLDPNVSPADRLTHENLAGYVAELKTLNTSSTAACRIGHLYMAIRAMAPERDWRWMRRVKSRLRLAGASKGKRARLVPSDELFSYGLELMAEAENAARNRPLESAMRYRDGLMIALMAARPLRRRNFVSIEIGRHLVRQGQGYWLRFNATETKTRVPIDAPFPQTLVPYLERYLSQYRPLLDQAGDPSKRAAITALWISRKGTAMSIGAFYGCIMKLTQAKFGHAINPHLFRDSAATSIATDDPEHVHVTHSVLGHSTLRTSERYYNHAKSLEATRRHQERILEMRRLGRDDDPGRFGSQENGEA